MALRPIIKHLGRRLTEKLIQIVGEKNRARLSDIITNTMNESERDQFLVQRNLLDEGATYRRLREAGFRPQGILDVGAFRGEWTQAIKRVFPDASVLMIEALASKEPELRAVATALVDVRYYIGVVGPESDQRLFYELESGSSLLEEMSRVERVVTMQRVVTLDSVVGSSRFDFVKLDVQGAELMVLKGASETLRHAQVVQLETQLIPINRGAPRLHEVIAFMHDRGFFAYDLYSPWRRPKDGALWSVDIMFLADGSPFVGEPRYD